MDFKKRFIDIEVGWPGSVRDAHIFENSYLGKTYSEYLEQFPTTPLLTGMDVAGNPHLEDVPAFILGDLRIGIHESLSLLTNSASVTAIKSLVY